MTNVFLKKFLLELMIVLLKQFYLLLYSKCKFSLYIFQLSEVTTFRKIHCFCYLYTTIVFNLFIKQQIYLHIKTKRNLFKSINKFCV